MMAFQTEDIITFNSDGEPLMGVVESIDGDNYTVRVLAVAGDDLVPTDNVVTITEADIMVEDEEMEGEDMEADEAAEVIEAAAEDDEEQALKEAIEAFDESDEEEIEEDEEIDEEQNRFEMGAFVEFDSAAGMTRGKVTGVKEDGTVEVEVYERFEDGYTASGIMVERDPDELKMCEDEIKVIEGKHLPRFAGKLKKAEVVDSDNPDIGTIKGYLSVFNNVDLGGDTVKRGAFKRTLDHKQGKIVFMADHGFKTDEVLGVLELEEDEYGLKMVGKMNLKTDQGRNAFETAKFQIENGVPIGASIGYELKKSTPNSAGGYDIEEAELWEGSMTPFPMNTSALITEAFKRYNRKARERRATLYNTRPAVGTRNNTKQKR